MMKQTRSPCYKCENRHENCHSRCKDYKEWLSFVRNVRKDKDYSIRYWEF